MAKTRVPKGEKYWYLIFYAGGITAVPTVDFYNGRNNEMFKFGNYFATEEEAEAMARKLRAVLAGADVIEMPGEEEIKSKAYMTAMNIVGDGDYGRDYYEGFIAGVECLKSKIVK